MSYQRDDLMHNLGLQSGAIMQYSRMVWSTFSPRLPGVVKASLDGLEHFFHICPFGRGGGGVSSYLGNAHIEPTHFEKGSP